MERNVILCGDVREKLRELENESVHCVVTSPPYWGLRDYGVDGQLGLESTPEAYVEQMVAVFREVRRVLRKDGSGTTAAVAYGAGRDYIGIELNPAYVELAKRRINDEQGRLL